MNKNEVLSMATRQDMFANLYGLMDGRREVHFLRGGPTITRWSGEVMDYVLFGDPPKDTVIVALLCNDTYELFDELSAPQAKHIKELVDWMLEYAPAACYGSEEVYHDWVKSGGAWGLGWRTNRVRSEL